VIGSSSGYVAVTRHTSLSSRETTIAEPTTLMLATWTSIYNLRSFGERLRDLWKENPHPSEADLKEAVKGAVQAMIAKARGQRRRVDTQRVAAESETPRDETRLPETRRMTRQDVPGPPSGRMLRGAESEVEQMHNYISCIGYNLHEAIRNRDADLIRSYRRALRSGIARVHETTNREAGARGWDPAAVNCMMREVEESTETLLPEAEQVLTEHACQYAQDGPREA
jgi:hypothetical protein